MAERLRVATAEGRLGPEELDQRLEALFTSRTYGELQRLVADLPAPLPAAPARSRGVPAPVWVAFTVSGALLLAVLGVLARGHASAAVAGQRGSGAPHQIFFSHGPSVPAAMLLTLVLAATLIAAAGWSYSRLAGRERRLSS